MSNGWKGKGIHMSPPLAISSYARPKALQGKEMKKTERSIRLNVRRMRERAVRKDALDVHNSWTRWEVQQTSEELLVIF